MTYQERLVGTLERMLRDGNFVMGLSKRDLADQFLWSNLGERTPTNEELVAAFMHAYDHGWIDFPGVESLS